MFHETGHLESRESDCLFPAAERKCVSVKRAFYRFLRRFLLLALVGGGIAWLWNELRPIHHPPGVLVRSGPVQRNYPRPSSYFPAREGYELSRLAQYRIRARVLSTKRYRDRNAALAPIDMALGWGPMSDTRVIDQLSISQGNRFYFLEWKKDPPLPKAVLMQHSANVHLIPANREVASFLSRVKEGSLVDFRGALVEARKQGYRWRSSLRRDDTGNGACEVLYVEQASYITPAGDRAEAETYQRSAEAARNDLQKWYHTLAEWRDTLPWSDAETIRAFNEEATRYQSAATRLRSRVAATPAASPAPTRTQP